jgi:hypothetical protein
MINMRKPATGELQKNLSVVESFLKRGKKLSADERTLLSAVLKQLKKNYPASGLGVSDEERIEIVRAMGEQKGHWFKCPNGKCLSVFFIFTIHSDIDFKEFNLYYFFMYRSSVCDWRLWRSHCGEQVP